MRGRLRNGALTESILKAALNELHVSHPSSACGAARDRLLAPVESPSLGAGVGTSRADLVTGMIRMSAAAGAQHVTAPAALSH